MADHIHALTEASSEILAEIRRLKSNRPTPIVVALDRGRGTGKSTLASLIEKATDAAMIQVDDFFAVDIPNAEWDARSTKERAMDVIDWRRLPVEALELLLAVRPAKWNKFDFEAGMRADGTFRMHTDYVKRKPTMVIFLDGAYSAGPQLADLVELTVLVVLSVDERHERLVAREEEGFLEQWHDRWDDVE